MTPTLKAVAHMQPCACTSSNVHGTDQCTLKANICSISRAVTHHHTVTITGTCVHAQHFYRVWELATRTSSTERMLYMMLQQPVAVHTETFLTRSAINSCQYCTQCMPFTQMWRASSVPRMTFVYRLAVYTSKYTYICTRKHIHPE